MFTRRCISSHAEFLSQSITHFTQFAAWYILIHQIKYPGHMDARTDTWYLPWRLLFLQLDTLVPGHYIIWTVIILRWPKDNGRFFLGQIQTDCHCQAGLLLISANNRCWTKCTNSLVWMHHLPSLNSPPFWTECTRLNAPDWMRHLQNMFRVQIARFHVIYIMIWTI